MLSEKKARGNSKRCSLRTLEILGRCSSSGLRQSPVHPHRSHEQEKPLRARGVKKVGVRGKSQGDFFFFFFFDFWSMIFISPFHFHGVNLPNDTNTNFKIVLSLNRSQNCKILAISFYVTGKSRLNKRCSRGRD